MKENSLATLSLGLQLRHQPSPVIERHERQGHGHHLPQGQRAESVQEL
jgi:hypothetical protein